MSERKQITISSVLGLLAEGKDRKAIGEHFDLSGSDLKKLFQHPKLKGKKPHKQPAFELVDDTNDQGEVIEEVTTTEGVATTDEPFENVIEESPVEQED